MTHDGGDPGTPRNSGGAGEMGATVAAADWSGSVLGSVEHWPQSLRTALDICLSSRFPMLVWWGPDLVQFYNDAYTPALGDKHPLALGQPAAECWAEAWDALGPLAASVLSGAGATYSEDQLLMVHRHGYVEESYWTFSYSPIADGHGGVGGVFIAVNDTTARVLGDRRLRTLNDLGGVSTAKSRTVEEACRSVVDVLGGDRADLPFALAYVRRPAAPGAPALVASFGVREGVAGVPRTLSHPRGSAPAWQQAVDGGPLLVTGLRERFPAMVRPDAITVGDTAPDAAMVLPIAGGATEPIGLLVLGVSAHRALDADYRAFLDLVAGQVSTAVTDALAYQAESHRAEALTELDRAKMEFFANVSHEFRTPLTLIVGPAEDSLLDRDEPLPAGQRKRMQLIRRNAGRLRRLVDDTLDFARIEASKLQPDAAPVDLATLTRGLVESFTPAVHRAGLELVVRCPPLPAPVSVDAAMWEKVVLNLLSNAVKYTHEGRIEVTMRAAAEHIELIVSDTGIGVPAEELPLLFHRFHRVRGSAGRSHEGAGIGLALVHELVRLHDGAVTARSTEGEGSTFTVRLPRMPVVGPAREAPARTPVLPVYLEEALQWSTEDEPAPSPVTAGTGASVLVVEDNPDLRRYIVRLLIPSWRVLQAADGRAGLAQAREHHPDLVLSDVMMPEMDGLDLLRELRADPATASIPVVLLSARADQDAAVEGLDAGADDYLPKPFSAPELVARIRSNLELSRLRTRESGFRRALVESLQEGLFVTDVGGRVVEVNDAFAALTGYGPEGLPYPYPYPWLVDADTDPDGRKISDAAFDAVVVGGGAGLYTGPIRHRDGRRRWVAASVTSVPDRDGTGRVTVGTLRDVTAERAAAERDATTVRFAAALAVVTDVHAVLSTGLTELQHVFAGTRAVAAHRTTDVGDPLVVSVPEGLHWRDLDEQVRRVLSAASEQPSARVTEQRAPDDPARVWAMAAALGHDAAVWLELGTPRGVATEDPTLFGLLAGHLAQALSRARSYDHARTVALTLQQAILGPTNLPPGFAVRYEPAVQPLGVGGDWYDVVSLAGGRIGLVVGDCVGQGLAAAAVMGQLRSACQALLLRAAGPAQVLTELDTFAGRIPGGRCTTVFCAIVDPGAGRVTYSCGGHLPAILVHPGGGTELLDGARSLPLAVAARRDRPEATTTLEPGATLLLYTDGLVERRGVSLDVGIDTARRTLAERHAELAPEAMADRLLADLQPVHGYDDDVAVLIYRHPPQPLCLVLPADPHRLAGLRRHLRRWLSSASVPESDAEEVVLALCEACSNAMEHGCACDPGEQVSVTVQLRTGRLDTVVRDTGVWKEPAADPDRRGRGLMMMRAFMDEVTLEPAEDGTTVRMSKKLPS